MIGYRHWHSYSASFASRDRSPVARLITRRHRGAAALATVGVAVLLTVCGGGTGTKTAPLALAAFATPASSITVVIKNFVYRPANFTVTSGATVTVLNQDAALHTLTADNRAFNTGNLSRGVPDTFQAPRQPGRYPYHSLRQPYMTGVLTVS